MDQCDVCEQDESKSDGGQSDTVILKLFDDLHCAIEQANNCLLLRQFEECLDICQKNITITRNYTENER